MKQIILLLGLIVILISGCNQDDEFDEIEVINRTGETIYIHQIVSAETGALIDVSPVISLEDSDVTEISVNAGITVPVVDIEGYTFGNDIMIFVYRQESEDPNLLHFYASPTIAHDDLVNNNSQVEIY